MTNYNDGKWHGWNGGECPVHPESVVEVVTRSYGPQKETSDYFGWWHGDHINPILAFRVVKEHKEPREAYLKIISQTYITGEEVETLTICRHDDVGAVLFREVVE